MSSPAIRHALILKSSPRRDGNSSALADEVAAGAREAGSHVTTLYLQGMDIRPCSACDACHREREGCIVQDDMQTVYPLLRNADAIVLASPVYWFTITAQAKLCVDRWYALESPEGSALRGKRFGLVLTYGDSDLYTSGGINAIYTFQSMCRYVRGEIAGMVYGTAMDPGDAQRQPELMRQARDLGRRLCPG